MALAPGSYTMQKYTDLESIRDRIEELQNEIADKTQAAEGIRELGQELCSTDNSDPELDCPSDCTVCAESAAEDIESERDELESEQDQLQAFVSETEIYFEPMVDHLLSENNGNFGEVTAWLGRNDFSVYDDWETYARDFIENNYSELPAFIAHNLDFDGIANELSMGETWEEIGGCVVIFY
jgi:hypothetical protein